jgi:hypothetical protein
MEELNAFIRLIEILRTQPVLTLFLILGMGYTGAYALANALLTIAGSIILFFLMRTRRGCAYEKPAAILCLIAATAGVVALYSRFGFEKIMGLGHESWIPAVRVFSVVPASRCLHNYLRFDTESAAGT